MEILNTIFGIRKCFKKQPQLFEETNIGKILISTIKIIIDDCKTAEEAQVKIWDFCETPPFNNYLALRQTANAYFEQKFGVKNINKNDVIEMALIE